MPVPSIEKLRDLKKKLEESSKDSYKGARLTPEGGKDFKRTGKTGTTPNPRKEGVAAADKAWEATQVKQGSTKPNPRKEGVAAADKEWLSPAAFREKIRGELGLPLNDKLNKGNDGLNKGAKAGTVEGNKAGTPDTPKK
jgi:hypothetical protein